MAYVAEDVITIPKLQLTEKAKSPEYLGNSLKICPWGDYSLYYIQDDPHLRIADPGAIEDANFRPVGRADATALNFKACILGVIKEKIGGGSNNRVIGDNTPEAVKEGAEIFSKDFPPYLHGFISSAIRNAKTGTPGSEMHFVVTENLNAGDTIAILSASKDDRKIITTTPGGKYVIASDIHGKFVAFQTQDDTGKSWPPRNWRKYNLGSQITYPPDLEMYLRIVNENPGRNIVFLPEKYAVRTTDEHVEIIDTSLPFHQPPVMIDKTLSVEDNIYVDPNNSKVIYYCSSNNPVDIVRLDLSKSPETWQTQATKLPQQYKKISHLQLDPTGNLFVLQTETGVVFLEKDTLKEVYQYPGVSCPHFDSKGNLKVVNKEGKIVICGGNFSEVTSALEARRVQAKMGGFKVQDVFAIEAQQVTATVGADITERFAFLAGDRTKYELGFQALIQQIRNLSDVPRVAEEIKRLEDNYLAADIPREGIDFVTGGIKAALNLKARECANAQAAEILSRIRGKLVQDLSLATVADITSDLQTLDSISGYLTSDTSKEATAIRDEFTSKSTELFKTKTAEITVQAKAIVARVKQQIAAIQDPASFAQFQDSIYPTTIAELGAIDRMCPPSIVEAHQAIQQAWAEVQRLANESVDRFTREYGKIREAAATTIQAKSDLLRRDITTLMTGLRLKGFKDIKAAETYLASNQVRQMIVEQIKDLRRQNPELADELELQLEVSTANLLGEIERGALVEIAGTGQQMVRIGKELFPKWEARKKEKEARSVQLVFLPDERTKGPNVKPDQIQGDIGLYIRNADGRTEKVRLFESLPDEDLYRFGLTTSKQIPVPRSYMTMEEFREFRKKYLDWNSGNPDSIKKRFEQARQAMKDHYKKRPEDHGGKTHMEWRQRYGELSDQYLRILKDEPVALLRRIDAIVNAPETEYPNGKGYVPEWQSHWTLDSHTVSNLERMARELRMQMELNAGMLDLIGHTGTGKDVLVRILACKDFANRPLFITDCTKWTTEAELAEDIFLGTTPEGGTFTYRLPSALLNGLQTEGAIIYLNEWTAMPHPAQIFLHGLLDEGRRITLKTQSGKVIEGAKGTLIIGSRNEDYPGLFEPGFATLNRVVPIRVGYPPLYKEEPTRSNPNPPFDPSEALRVARSVRSLKGFTLNPIPDKNIFIKIFDRKINGREDISIPKLTKEQEEDLETVVALVQFANNLRQNFALVFSKDPDAYKALPVSIPISGRELRWCAYRLSKMTAEEKTNPDQVARKLLAEYFVDKISDANDRQKVLDAMEGWSLVKRPATSPKRTK